MNCELSGDQILQAFLPVKTGGLGFAALPRWHLPPSWLLPRDRRTSSHKASPSWGKITNKVPDFTRNRMLDRWKSISGSPPPPDKVYGKQKFLWQRKITEQSFSILLANCTSQIDKARILTTKATHAGDWLNAPPITSIGLRMSNETIRVAVGPSTWSKIMWTRSMYMWRSSWCQGSAWPQLSTQRW